LLLWVWVAGAWLRVELSQPKIDMPSPRKYLKIALLT
jgi:hypothetical protein